MKEKPETKRMPQPEKAVIDEYLTVTETESEEYQIMMNRDSLFQEVNWLSSIIHERLFELWTGRPGVPLRELTAPPELGNSAYRDFIERYDLDVPERLCLAICIAANLEKETLLPLLTEQEGELEPMEEAGGVYSSQFGHYFPGLQTAGFLLAGNDEETALYYYCRLIEKSVLFEMEYVQLVGSGPMDLDLPNHLLLLDDSLYQYFLNSLAA